MAVESSTEATETDAKSTDTDASRNGNGAPATGEKSDAKTSDIKADTKADETGETEKVDSDLAKQLADAIAEAEKWKTHARKNEERAKANNDARKELERVQRESMSEQERILADARDEARNEVIREFSGRLVDSEFRAAAAGRIPDERLSELKEVLDLSKFLNEDGSVNGELIAKAINTIAPPNSESKGTDEGKAPETDANNSTDQKTSPPATGDDLGQGAGRSSEPHALNGDPLLAALKSTLGI